MSCPISNDIALIIKKLENIEHKVQTNSQTVNTSLNNIESELKTLRDLMSREQNTNAINGFISSKEQFVKDKVREFMLTNFNIQALNDSIEGEIYDFIVDKIWDLIIKHVI